MTLNSSKTVAHFLPWILSVWLIRAIKALRVSTQIHALLTKNQNFILLPLNRKRPTASWLPNALPLKMSSSKSKSFVFCPNVTETAELVSLFASISSLPFTTLNSVLSLLLQEV
jgi:hypothetical protein